MFWTQKQVNRSPPFHRHFPLPLSLFHCHFDSHFCFSLPFLVLQAQKTEQSRTGILGTRRFHKKITGRHEILLCCPSCHTGDSPSLHRVYKGRMTTTRRQGGADATTKSRWQWWQGLTSGVRVLVAMGGGIWRVPGIPILEEGWSPERQEGQGSGLSWQPVIILRKDYKITFLRPCANRAQDYLRKVRLAHAQKFALRAAGKTTLTLK